MVSLPLNLSDYIKNNPFFLAPMAGVTDNPFRSFMREMGCGLITTELVSARGLKEKHKKTLQLMEFEECQRPVGIQIFGESADTLGEGAKIAQDTGADFVDLNLGCPVNKIVKKGAGSALLKDLKILATVLRKMRSETSLPLSLKVRMGWDQNSLNAGEVAHIAYNEGFSWMTIHGRTRSQGYSGQADWNYIKKIKAEAPLPIIGNGDLKTARQALEKLKFSQCDGVMIGRGCLKNPWIFLEALTLLTETTETFNRDCNQLIRRLKNHLEKFYDEKLFLLQIKKFCAWFSAGIPHSAPFRQELFMEKDRDKVMEMIEEFFNSSHFTLKEIKEYGPELMRGHG
ncbi:MAG: tRNA dihydrouridine synthase DusB [Bdellovibrionales bacterium]|nr:tRNA dihydrouridine synthase DusB [Bdellovibrionales bacterium]